MIQQFFITLAYLLLIIFLQILYVRNFSKHDSRVRDTAIIFFLGLIIFAYVVTEELQNIYSLYRLTNIILYLLLIADYFVLILSPLLGDESPSGSIIRVLNTSHKIKKNVLTNKFSNKLLIYNRIDKLICNKLVQERNRKYFSSEKGLLAAKLIQIYRTLLRMNTLG